MPTVFVTVKRSGFEEQVFQVFAALAEELIPESSLCSWLVSGIMQYDTILDFHGSQEFRFNTDDECTHVHRHTDTRMPTHTCA